MSAPNFSDSFYQTFKADATLPAYTRVLLNADNEVAAAGVTDRAIGYIDEHGAVANEFCTVRMVGAPSQLAIANAALETGDILYAAAAGEVDDVDAGTAIIVGRAGSTATNAGDIVLVLPVD